MSKQSDLVNIAQGDTITVDHANGRVGIGTSSPQAKLQVLDTLKVSTADQSSGSVILGDGGSTAFNVGIARWNGATNATGAGGVGYFAQGPINAGGHFFYTGDAAAGSTTERMRIDSSGNVGIGTSSPDATLTVEAAQGLVSVKSTTGSKRVAIGSDAFTDAFVGTTTAHNLSIISGGNIRATFDTSGNVGIGTSSPLSTFEISAGANNTYMRINDTRASAPYVGSESGAMVFGLWGIGERMRIDSSGRVGIGTTSPSYKLETPHVIRTHGIRTNDYNTGGFNASKVGYIGSNLTSGDNALYYIGELVSGTSSNASANWVNFYRSGHWAQHTRLNVYGITTYYDSGFSKWHINDLGGVSLIEGWGPQGSISVSNTLVGAGTDNGQDINRFNITFTNPGTYYRLCWYVGFVGGGTHGHISSAHSVSQADDYFRTRGGGVHFTTLSNSSISESPFYRELLQ